MTVTEQDDHLIIRDGARGWVQRTRLEVASQPPLSDAEQLVVGLCREVLKLQHALMDRATLPDYERGYQDGSDAACAKLAADFLADLRGQSTAGVYGCEQLNSVRRGILELRGKART